MRIYKKKHEVCTNSKNAHNANKIRLCEHLRRYEKIVKHLYEVYAENKDE